MRHWLIGIAFALCAFASYAAGAEGKGPALTFDPPEGAQTFEAGKAAFKERKFDAANEQLVKARKAAKGKETQQEVERWLKGLAGLLDLAILERNLEKEPGWVYENAQRKLLVYIATPAADFFRRLLTQIEDSDKKLILKFECFEDAARVYSAALGRTYVNKASQPQYVIEGQQSLKWECTPKNDKSRFFRIHETRVPKDWSEYDYLGFWMYGVPGSGSKVQLCLTNERADARKEAKGKAGAKVAAADGFQTEIPAHDGWRFITLGLKENLKGTGTLHKIGGGDLKKVSGLQFQLASIKKFVTYMDSFVLIKSK